MAERKRKQKKGFSALAVRIGLVCVCIYLCVSLVFAQSDIVSKRQQLENLTQKIFDYVRQHPENLRQIRQFLNYYLPTTIKLLEQYVVLQNQGMRVGNIDEGMTKIENMLEKVIAAFQQQLDSLFENDVVDITAEIRVMEKTMASEGLAGGNDFE